MLSHVHTGNSDIEGGGSCTLTQVGLPKRGMVWHQKHQKVFIEEVGVYTGRDWWADEARPFPHMHVVRPTVTDQKCFNVINVKRILGPAMVLRDPATPTVPKGALP